MNSLRITRNVLSHICFCLPILVSTLSPPLHGLQFVFFSYSCMWSLPYSVVNPKGVTALKKTLSRSYRMPKAPQLADLFLLSFLCARILYDLILCRSCVQCHTCCGSLCETAGLHLEDKVSLMLSTTATSYNFSDYSSVKISESG